jgi:hypothetical protein
MELEAKKTIFGVDTHMATEENADIKNLILMPLGEYRGGQKQDISKQHPQEINFPRLLKQRSFNR